MEETGQSDFEEVYKFNSLIESKYFSTMKKEGVEITPIQKYAFNVTKQEDVKLAGQWRRAVQNAVKDKKTVAQVQVCDIPLADEMKMLLMLLSKEVKYGENFLAITTADFMKAARNWDLNTQFWLIDDSKAVMTYFSNEGQVMGFAELSNEKLISRLRGIKERCLAVAVPVDEFYKKYGSKRR